MKTVDNAGVTFVNTLLGRGVLNGVINLSFGVLLFTPSDDDKTVDPDIVVASRLRMDVACAKQLHEALGDLLVLIEQAGEDPAPGIAPQDASSLPKPN